MHCQNRLLSPSSLVKDFPEKPFAYPLQRSLTAAYHPSTRGLNGSMLPVLTGYLNQVPIAIGIGGLNGFMGEGLRHTNQYLHLCIYEKLLIPFCVLRV